MINLILGLVKKDSGKIFYSLNKDKAFNNHFGVQLQNATFDERLTIRDYCFLLEKAYHIESGINSYLAKFDLLSKKNKK